MSIFGSILHKLGLGGDEKKAEETTNNEASGTPQGIMDSSAANAETPAGAESVDVEAILNDLAAKSNENLDWKHSIVDLLKLLGIDSSYAHRKQLAEELGIQGYEGTADQNIELHRIVMVKLAENGGKVPSELLA
ncbi:DUF3597 domain-containing protein [Nitratifractor salsuginis]|uniref:DUF3597 domain-containing protein n=1 Tax=Nitratifractor salsuginis (strain DSM 16511 / JCM 12458 / E9I37-1) TaxID=749222 RepID=E6X3K1_NITSE|nr:DUF3597 domain-containing protein [Nitratifractor salsuginis]ADV46278.1 hypothetical protein Nitsa_1020 [Nitratifractor salsuginis DSM 16511]